LLNKPKITVVGSGFVGMSLAVLFAQHNDVTVLDVDINKINKINNRLSTVKDAEISMFLSDRELSIFATNDRNIAYLNADFIIIATPTNYDEFTKRFDTSLVDIVIEQAHEINNDALIVIKSTVPVGYTVAIQKKLQTKKITFSPEFLREGFALKDNLYPARIVVGSNCNQSIEFSKLLEKGAEKKDIKKFFTDPTEAEAIKLFSNTYLAMRVSFFNELDTFALSKGIESKNIIDGICEDPRIGDGYNNPSFGVGGYCLPKDNKQLVANFDFIPQTLIKAVISSNVARREFIANKILEKNPKVVGFYRLIMKNDSDNFRESATQDVIKITKATGVKIIIYEPYFSEDEFEGAEVLNDINEFISKSDIIVANRISNEIKHVRHKIFSRDIYREN
jgi:UDPglucose 6-dehydrogenase